MLLVAHTLFGGEKKNLLLKDIYFIFIFQTVSYLKKIQQKRFLLLWFAIPPTSLYPLTIFSHPSNNNWCSE